MQIDVSCPSCGATFKVDEQHIGKTGKCATCSSRVKIERSQPRHPLSPAAPPVAAPPVPGDWPTGWPKERQAPAPVVTQLQPGSKIATFFQQWFDPHDGSCPAGQVDADEERRSKVLAIVRPSGQIESDEAKLVKSLVPLVAAEVLKQQDSQTKDVPLLEKDIAPILKLIGQVMFLGFLCLILLVVYFPTGSDNEPRPPRMPNNAEPQVETTQFNIDLERKRAAARTEIEQHTINNSEQQLLDEDYLERTEREDRANPQMKKYFERLDARQEQINKEDKKWEEHDKKIKERVKRLDQRRQRTSRQATQRGIVETRKVIAEGDLPHDSWVGSRR